MKCNECANFFCLQCVEEEMDLSTAEIEELADKINSAISGVSNVDQILDDTNDNLTKAKELKDNAEVIRDEALQQLEKANNITRDLSAAVEAQNIADQKIQTTQTDIDSARKDLATVSISI